ncbi:hypothetical protein I6H88_11200 [Elizabethkingia bruuniana]|uniref:O-antigen ligase domain-containing protein n=1 Tax=Elizabethkingia bruuniana TaxID=1756149 RepID=A0A7T7UVX1_9FLAO|nr:hypothetical protein [Elizabethkingia bruuniana]OPB62467.1 hypothetical protein BAY12_11225 [Elizabethkingia bruuniana]QDZ63601.1 hypothetical protein EVD20_14805 [Elizabethkingia bruuniana]QQN57029.1 hypothetical protein I6H88_11200 [Elizabethkingia bruuniana]
MIIQQTEENRISVIYYILTGIIVSCYFFPFEFTFLPRGINTKIMLAVIGLLCGVITSIQKDKIEINKELIPAILLAILFSIIGFISVDINHTDDYTYASYISSFSVWLFGAYATYRFIRYIHGYVDFRLIMNYLIAVCVIQCILALLIDNVLFVKTFVDNYISQATVADVKFLNEAKRLYGIGAAVDVAGTRFSIILIGLVAVMARVSAEGRGNTVVYWAAFVIIGVVGNMISRTTTIGMVLALVYLFLNSKLITSEISFNKLKFWRSILIVSFLLILVTVFFYNTYGEIREQLRFGFEGFFNWVEEGEWKTDSTDKLNTEMWIWPNQNDLKTWIIGRAVFADWHIIGTDIGYCRFIFYNGLLGLITFSLFFVYNAWACTRKFPAYTFFFIMLLGLSFIIWLKVATDLFIIYALFYCLDNEEKNKYLK